MYKVTYKTGKGNLEILKVEKLFRHSWVEETSEETIKEITEKFMLDKNLYWKDLEGEATGIAVYNNKFKYVTGHLLKIKRDKDVKLNSISLVVPIILTAKSEMNIVQPMAIIFILFMMGFILWAIDKSKK